MATPMAARMAHGHRFGHGDVPVLTLNKGRAHFDAQKVGKDFRGRG